MCWQVNGREVGQDPRVIQEELQAANGIIVLKILPSYHEAIPPRQVTDIPHSRLYHNTILALWTRCIVNLRWLSVRLQVFFKCHYDYHPANDNLIPCKEAGLRFETGDILQIVNQDDVNWWQVEQNGSCAWRVCLDAWLCRFKWMLCGGCEQARHVEGGSTGLIPSQMLEEKRKAFVKRDMELPPAG